MVDVCAGNSSDVRFHEVIPLPEAGAKRNSTPSTRATSPATVNPIADQAAGSSATVSDASCAKTRRQPRRALGLRPWLALLVLALCFFFAVRLDTVFDGTGWQ